MVDLRRCLGLVEEPLHHLRLQRVLRHQHLERDLAIQLDIPRGEHHPKRTLAEELENLVATDPHPGLEMTDRGGLGRY